MGKQGVAGTKKTKEAIAKAASSRSGAGAKKKWTRGRVKDKAQNAVIFDQPLFDKLLQESAKMKLITVSTLVDRLKICGALARKAIRYLAKEGLAKSVSDHHHAQYIYTTSVVKKAVEPTAKGAKQQAPAKGQKKQAVEQKQDKPEKAE